MDSPEKIAILIVDDYPANLMALAAVLDRPHYEVIEATSGLQALQILKERQIALILLDVQMPGMDGYQVAREIRKNPLTRDIPIIFVTAVYREDPAVRLGYQAGGQDYLGKPYDPEVLRAKVEIYSNMFIRTVEGERKRRALEASEQRYRQIVEGAREIMATIDVQGTITSLNLAFERLTGFPCREWVGRSFLPLMEAEDLARLLTALESSAEGEPPELLEATLSTASGGQVRVEISVQPLVQDGARTGAIGVMRDVSPRTTPTLPPDGSGADPGK
jgi:PAS domain S-box-containing protein